MANENNNASRLAELVHKNSEVITINGIELTLFAPTPTEIRAILQGASDDKIEEMKPEEGMDMLIKMVKMCLKVDDEDLVWQAIVGSGGIDADESPLIAKCMKLCGLEGGEIDPKILGMNREQRRAYRAQQRKDKQSQQPSGDKQDTSADVP